MKKNEGFNNLDKISKAFRDLEKQAAEILEKHFSNYNPNELHYNTDKLFAGIDNLEVFKKKGEKKINEAVAAAFNAGRIPFKIGQTLSAARNELERKLKDKEQKS